ncbi:hypothetical protein BDV23DRAFT_194938 [Aspergillus alliaceus]|uniref:Major facilitator superfamily domain-containing protein n=1 Tax=Petromyces alliaceus TaxID=209559 RepID=A0A5N7CNB5_PETAA|nr:hypothetical protein BDV23DRAFT_194938 [Aspergillus alliaceus]
MDHGRTKELSKTPTNISNIGTLASRTLLSPADGGFVVWYLVALDDFVISSTWGYINDFGVFHTYYTETLGHPSSGISWIRSIPIFLLFFIGTFSGQATDAGYSKATLILGRCWSVGQGIGCRLMFCPTIVLIPTYFAKKRSIAMGIVASRSETGGLVFPALGIRTLIPYFFYISSFARDIIDIIQVILINILLTAVSSLRDIYIFSIFFSLAAAGIQSLFPIILSTLTRDLRKASIRIDIVFSVVTVTVLIGSPITGSLVQLGNGQCLCAQMFMGSAMIASVITLQRE